MMGRRLIYQPFHLSAPLTKIVLHPQYAFCQRL
nr:MAG TPA: hypothetical protein [Caudoviricetes sp.]